MTTAYVCRTRVTSVSFYRNSICFEKKRIKFCRFSFSSKDSVVLHGQSHINMEKMAIAAGLNFQMNSLASCEVMTSSGFQGLVDD